MLADYLSRLSAAASAASAIVRAVASRLLAVASAGAGSAEGALLVEPVALSIGTFQRPVVVYNPLAWEMNSVSRAV